MKSTIFTTLVLLALTVFSPAAALGWDDAGHKITTFIAWQEMTPAARAKATEILLAAPEDSMLSAYFSGDSRSESARQMELFMIASTWADIVRDRKFAVRYAKYHHSNWHYADTFWTEENGKIKLLGNTDGEGGKAVEKLYEFEKLLSDPKASNADKAIALAWVLHLAGDIHQPLHASARVTDLEPKGDQGGNLFLLSPKDTPRDKQMNLHWFMDSIVGRNVLRGDACDSDYLVPIANSMIKKYPAKSADTVASFDVWQQESVKLTQEKVFTNELVRYQMPSEKYTKSVYELSQARLAAAGHRIAVLLNRILTAK